MGAAEGARALLVAMETNLRLADLLRQVPGVPKRFVYYLEAQGVIRPGLVPKQRIARREYTDEDVQRVKRIWEYYRRGYSLQAARDLADGGSRTVAYALLQVPPRRWADALEVLRAAHQVQEAAVVYGQSVDLVARLEVALEEEVFQVLDRAFDRGDVAGPPTILKVAGRTIYHLPSSRRPPHAICEGGRMLAYVLIKVPAKHADTVLEQLRAFQGITEASVVYGETDIIARVEVPSQAELDHLVVRSIQDLPMVESTRTFIAIGGMHWRREPGAEG